jgi:mono/diheme cytochrome c family protein
MQGNRVLVGVVVLGLAVASASFAQDIGEFQRQMMERMMQQNREKMQKGEADLPGFAKVGVADRGKAIFNSTSLGNNGKSCGSCHQEGQGPLDGRQVDNHLVAYVQYCYEHALGGEKVIAGDKLDKIMGYLKSLQKSQASSSPPVHQPEEEEPW